MKVIDDLKKETINKAVKELASGVQEVDTNHSTSYVELKDFTVRCYVNIIPRIHEF